MIVEKKKKIIRIIIIIVALVDEALDHEEDPTLYNEGLVAAEWARAHFWDTDELNWSQEELDAWAAVEAIAGDTGVESSPDWSALIGNLQDKLARI